MKQLLPAVAIAALLLCHSQPRTGTTRLQVEVGPEAYVSPRSLTLRFHVSADGSADIIRQTEAIRAWARGSPGHAIRLTAHPSASWTAGAIRWNSGKVAATQGGESADCTGGAFTVLPAADLVRGWSRSGTLTCSVRFELCAPRSLPPGDYVSEVVLILSTD